EVTSLIDAAPIAFYRTILMTLYGTGVRRAECAALKLTDIDSARMVVHIQEGKGGKDRDIVLSPHLRDELRAHYRRLTRKPAVSPPRPPNPPVWLFPGGCWPTADTPSATRLSGTPVGNPPNAPGSTSRCIRTLFDIASPHICSKPAPICAPSNCCSATPTCA